MSVARRMAEAEGPSDEELMRRVAGGARDALRPLYRRYARLVFNLARPTLGHAGADDVVQEVFLAVWRNATAYDPARGPFRPWVLQIAHYRILNELRRRSRQPDLDADPDGTRLAGMPADEPGPAEATWRARRGATLRAALDELPAREREAVDLGFFEDLTHSELARELDLPLGTAKTRIRTALRRLRAMPAVAALALGAAFAVVGARVLVDRSRLALDDRALTLLTASDSVNLRLAPVAGVPDATHARYRGRAGSGLGVVTTSAFPAPPAGEEYAVWVRHGDAWLRIGTIRPDAAGSARLIVEDPRLATLPDGVEITRERTGATSGTPNGAVVVAWPNG